MMPELPEVEVISSGIRPHLVERIILAVRTSGKRLRQPVPDEKISRLLQGRKIYDVRRRAKFMEVHFYSGEMLIFHFGMTGNLGIFTPPAPPARHDHVCFLLDNGRELRFNDTRRFGAVYCLSAEEAAQREETIYKTMGPEPLGPDFSPTYLLQRAQGRNAPVKTFLMDSRIVVGIGNIYANEALFEAGIAPNQPTGSLLFDQWQRLATCCKEVLKHAIECGGSTISDFVNASGQSGYFQMNFHVYGREGSPCHRCGNNIIRSVIGGRASFMCPHCQRSEQSGR